MAETNGADHVLWKHPYVKKMRRCYLGVCVADTMFGMALSRLLILLDSSITWMARRTLAHTAMIAVFVYDKR